MAAPLNILETIASQRKALCQSSFSLRLTPILNKIFEKDLGPHYSLLQGCGLNFLASAWGYTNIKLMFPFLQDSKLRDSVNLNFRPLTESVYAVDEVQKKKKRKKKFIDSKINEFLYYKTNEMIGLHLQS